MSFKMVKLNQRKGLAVEGNTLPVHDVREHLIRIIGTHNVIIVAGETACGKTTQIPQFLLDDQKMTAGKLIGVTQPRRIAAISLAKRVAKERGEDVGGTVGYAVRFDNKTSSATQLKYMTDGILLKEVLSDPTMSKYSVIILDEVHERSLNTDLLLGILHNAVYHRNKGAKQNLGNLKVIIMSATMNIKLLTRLYPDAGGVYISGRMHAIDTFDLVTEHDDYVAAIVSQVCLLHDSLPFDHHFLAFLPGKEEITTIVSILKSFNMEKLEVLPLYAALAHEAQMKAIDEPTAGIRRVIVSTNIAETSLTIPGIRVVIDSGFVNRKKNLGHGYSSLQTMQISKAEAYQRAGRAGREADGRCYRFYSAEDFNKMEEFPEPEIRRASITSMLLTLLGLGINRPSIFPWLEPPSPDAMKMAVLELNAISAVTTVTEPLNLTVIGQHMALAPIEPKFANILLMSMSWKLLKEVASVLAVLSSEPIFNPCTEEVEMLRSDLYHPDGDLMSYVQIMKKFRNTRCKKVFCKTYKMNIRSLRFACKAREQLIKYAMRVSNPEVAAQQPDKYTMSENLRRLFISSMPFNVAQLDDDVYRTRRSDGQSVDVKIHPGSTLIGKRIRTIHFVEVTELLSGSVNYISHISRMQSSWIQYGSSIHPANY